MNVDNAIIMAAGLSSRFAPLSYETPKGLIEVKNEVLIERQVNQLHSAGINEIYVITGYMAEKFQYLVDKLLYGSLETSLTTHIYVQLIITLQLIHF